MRKKIIFLILIGFSFASLFAQERLRCKQISLEQGLSQTSVFAVAQDKLGFIWIGTESGLNRYDGYQFRVYSEDRLNPHSICNSYIWSLLVDSAGDLWVGTDGGLCKYVPQTDSFISYLNDPQASDSLSNNRVFALYEDRAKNLWVGTDGGLNRLDRRSGKFTRHQSAARDKTTLSNDLVRAIFQDHNGFLWVGTDGGGLNRLNPQTGKFDHFRHIAGNADTISNDSVGALYEDREGTLWIGTRAGLDRLDAARTHYQHYRQKADDPFALSNDWINCIFADRSGTLWFGTNEGGVCQYLPKRNGFISFRHDPDDVTSLGSDRVLSMIEDDSENIWFGTYAAGLSKYNKNVAKFKLYRQERNNPNSLSSSVVRNIYKESQNIIWVATDGGGLNRIDRASGKYTVYMKNPSDPRSISSNRPFSILRDREGTMWVTTADGGLNKFDSRTEKFTSYMNDPGNLNSIGSNFVRTVVEDREGYLWLGLDGGGVNRFDKRTGFCKRYMPEAGNSNSLSFYRVFSLCYDKDDILWIGTYGGGLNRFDPKTESFKTYRYTPSMTVPEKTLDNYVLCLIEDSRGNFWLGTSKGLTRFDRDKETFRTYLLADGLPDEVIYAIVEDHEKNLWLTSNRGLSRFNPMTEKFKNFDVNDGLQSYEFNTYGYCKGDDGELFFGGVNGFNSFYPDQLIDNTHVPSIVLTRFQLFNRDVPIGKPIDRRVVLNRAIGATDRITLAYTQNAFSFEFSALDYKAPEKNQYAYMMVGLDKEWNYVGNRRFVAYAGLPPGKYTFRVKGSNNDGVWNNDGASLKIIITPPFWQTWWFISLSALFIGGTAVGIVQMRIRRLIHAKHELERLVAKRTQALVEANDYLENLFDYANAPIIVWDPQFRITRFNHAFETLTSRISAEALGKRLEILFPPEQSEASMELIQKKLSGERREVVEINIKHMDGSIRTVLWNSATLLSADGKIAIATISQIQDITGRKITEEKIKNLLAEKELILKEVHHRIKNNMATVQGLFSLQADTLKNPEAIAALKDAGSRVQSMVVLYEKLYQSIGSEQVAVRNYLPSLVDEIVANFPNSAKVKVEKKIADFVLNAKKLQPLGIIINELLTNIMKYAFTGRSDGLITVSAELKGNRVSLAIQDNGIGMPETVDFENSTGFGLKLVSMLIKQIAGTIRIEHGNGTQVILEFEK